MILVLALALLPLHFTAPANAPVAGAAAGVRESRAPVKGYLFYRLDGNGVLAPTPGYADSTGGLLLGPHEPGTRETVWVPVGGSNAPATIYVMSLGTNGSTSSPSNGCVIGRISRTPMLSGASYAGAALQVPMVRQTRQRCGQAALVMVLRYYGAAPAALREADAAYDPVLRGSLITDLAAAARRAGYAADVATLTPDSLVELLHAGVPPILLYQNGPGPLTVRHFGVVTGWDATNTSFTVLDGSASPRLTSRDDLAKRWMTAGSQALIVRPLQP